MVPNSDIPVIDISAFFTMKNETAVQSNAARIKHACIENGFFYINGHGVEKEPQINLEQVCKSFFALPESEKLEISMSKGGRAWRGYFPVGQEVTSGIPDKKEGLYFGTELATDHTKVLARLPLHGPNLFPSYPTGMKITVIRYMEAITKVGHAVMRGIAISLDLPFNYFENSITKDPFILFRVFHYPPQVTEKDWGVGEHTDYGLLTILKQDEIGGLQVRSNGVWIDAPPIPDTFVCNIGDMLDRMSHGLYHSTPHRVLNNSGKGRMSFPLFFDPNFERVVKKIDSLNNLENSFDDRWDNENVYNFEGRYGEYVVKKVSKVFPDLFKDIMT